MDIGIDAVHTKIPRTRQIRVRFDLDYICFDSAQVLDETKISGGKGATTIEPKVERSYFSISTENHQALNKVAIVDITALFGASIRHVARMTVLKFKAHVPHLGNVVRPNCHQEAAKVFVANFF